MNAKWVSWEPWERKHETRLEIPSHTWVGSGFWCLDMVTYNPPSTWTYDDVWYNQGPFFISSHEQLDQEIGYWSRFERLSDQGIGAQSFMIAKRSMSCMIEDEMKSINLENAISLDPNVYFIFLSFIYFMVIYIFLTLHFLHFTFLYFTFLAIYFLALYWFPLLSCHLYFQHFTFLYFTFTSFTFLALYCFPLLSCNS